MGSAQACFCALVRLMSATIKGVLGQVDNAEGATQNTVILEQVKSMLKDGGGGDCRRLAGYTLGQLDEPVELFSQVHVAQGNGGPVSRGYE